MIDPKAYAVTSETQFEEVDLETEPHYLPDGTRLTEAEAAERGERAAREYESRRGRPSLSSSGAHSPRVSVRLPEDIYHRLAVYAEVTGMTVSALARKALIEWEENTHAMIRADEDADDRTQHQP